METINVIIIALGTSLASSFGTWLFSKRKYSAEVASAEIANYKIIIDDWQKAAEDWRKSAEEYRKIMLEQRKEMDLMLIKIDKLEADLKKANCKISKIEKEQK